MGQAGVGEDERHMLERSQSLAHMGSWEITMVDGEGGRAGGQSPRLGHRPGHAGPHLIVGSSCSSFSVEPHFAGWAEDGEDVSGIALIFGPFIPLDTLIESCIYTILD